MLPTLFISHGAPTLGIEDNQTSQFLRTFGTKLPRPTAIICVTAHWVTRHCRVSTSAAPQMIYDFYGFPEVLYRIKYPAPGNPALAGKVIDLLQAAGIENVQADAERGYDHGTWVPLSLLYPDASIPIVQISVQPYSGTRHHLEIGKALQPLVAENILIIGSGSATHNLRDFGQYAENEVPQDYALKFDHWLENALLTGNDDEVLNYLQRAPYALQNHPTPEHFLPLLIPMGAHSSEQKAKKIHNDISYGFLSYAAYAWGLF